MSHHFTTLQGTTFTVLIGLVLQYISMFSFLINETKYFQGFPIQNTFTIKYEFSGIHRSSINIKSGDTQF